MKRLILHKRRLKKLQLIKTKGSPSPLPHKLLYISDGYIESTETSRGTPENGS